jgi:hypothetical protein
MVAAYHRSRREISASRSAATVFVGIFSQQVRRFASGLHLVSFLRLNEAIAVKNLHHCQDTFHRRGPLDVDVDVKAEAAAATSTKRGCLRCYLVRLSPTGYSERDDS